VEHLFGSAYESHGERSSELRGERSEKDTPDKTRRSEPAIKRLLAVFENTQIQTRYFSRPLEWFATQRTFVESSVAYAEAALQLAVQAARVALDRAQISPAAIDLVVLVSTTGITTPSLDAKLIQALGIASSAKRLPVWGLGCAGGVAGLARCTEALQGLQIASTQTVKEAQRPLYALFVAVETCSLTFQRNDVSKSNIVATSLFADGAGAVVMRCGEAFEEQETTLVQAAQTRQTTPTSKTATTAHIIGSYSRLFDNTEDIMGWDVLDTGLKVRFSRDIPSFIRQHLPQTLDAACSAWQIARSDLKHFVVHAGGAKVLQAYNEALHIPESSLQSARHVLRTCGNMSSASVMFALEEFLAAPSSHNEHDSTSNRDGELGVMMALGPGFSAEFVLFQCSR
jgi:alkylresorcinol/alkylpyrone synthase